jgi:predicted kinase
MNESDSLPVLILLVGLPYSGKSTWARAYNRLRSAPIVSPDAIRLALHGDRFEPEAERMVWTLAHYMVDSLFEAGHREVILDACNGTPERRAEWESERWDLRFVVVPTSPEVCIARAEDWGDEEILPVIKCMAVWYDPPMDGEVAELYRVPGWMRGSPPSIEP